MKIGIALEEAREILRREAKVVGEESIPLMDALGRVLSRDLSAKFDLPAFNKSPLDGYALAADDLKKDPSSQENFTSQVSLQVIEEVRAGFVPKETITPGTTIKVMTGTPIPEGADTVVRFEDVARAGDSITISSFFKKGSNIIYAGEDVVAGEVVAKKGTMITPPLVGLLAGLGFAQVPVYRKVRVGIISTGDELMRLGEELRPGKIYNSSLYNLTALCRSLGTEPVVLGIVSDQKKEIAEKFIENIGKVDILISTGGVSVGDYDLVQEVLKDIKAQILYWKVAMKPGTPILAAKSQKKLIIGLSGNPGAALITFDLIVVPAIKKMMGLNAQLPPQVEAVLGDEFLKASPQRRFIRAKLQVKDGRYHARLTGKQGSGVLKSLVDCNALIDIPAKSGVLHIGEKVTAVVVGNVQNSLFAIEGAD